MAYTDLIPIYPQPIGQKTVASVSARDLHGKLGIKRDFMTWLQQYITKGDWRKDHDFSVFNLSVENPQGGRPGMDAALSIQMAEHIAMMTRTPKGREIREYFRRARDERDAVLPTSRGDILVQMAEAYRVQEQRVLAIESASQEFCRQQLAQQQALIVNQAQALEALERAMQAESNANRALDSQLFFTVAEYVYVNKLEAQLPTSGYRACSDHLRLYCMDRGIPFRKIPVGGQRWDEEYAFHSSVYAEALPGWLTRRFAQPPLRVLPTKQEETS